MEKILQKLPELDEAGTRSYLSTIDKMLSRGDMPVSEQEMVSEVRKHVVERWKAAKAKPVAPAPEAAPVQAAPPAAITPTPKKVGKTTAPLPRLEIEGDLDPQQEADLAKRAQSGDMQAKEQLAMHYEGMVKSIAGRIRRPPNVELDDLIGEGNATLTRLMNLPAEQSGFDPAKGRFSTFIYGSLRRDMWTFVKNANKKAGLQSPESQEGAVLPESPEEKADTAPPVDEQLMAKEDSEWFIEHINQLPENQKAVMLRLREGQTMPEIAAEFNLTRERVRQIKNGAEQRLRRMAAGGSVLSLTEAEQKPLVKTALNKLKGGVLIHVGQDQASDDQFLNDLDRMLKKLDTMDEPALRRQIAVVKEQLEENPLTTDRQKQFLAKTISVLQARLPQQQAPVEPPPPRTDDIQGSVFQFGQILGRELQAVPDQQLNENDRDAGEYAMELGLTPVFVTSKDGSELPLGGISFGKVIVLRSNIPEESLWDIVSHEVTHGTGLDAKNKFDKRMLKKKADEYYSQVSKSRREDLDDPVTGPAMRQREGAAMLVGEFGRSPSLRKQIREGSPSFYTQIRDKILDAVGIKIPKYKAFRETIEFFRQEREKTAGKSAGQNQNPASDPTKEVKPAQAGSLKDVVQKRVGKQGEGAQDIRQAADIAEAEAPTDEARGFFGGGGIRRRNDQVPGNVQHPDPDIEKNFDNAYGAPKATALQRIKEWRDTFLSGLRPQYHIPNDAGHADMNERFRLLKQIPTSAADEANRNIAAITDQLGPQQFQLFTRKVIMDNLLAAVDRGEPRRFGFKDRNDIALYKRQLDQLALASPEVTRAIAARKVVVMDIYQLLRSKDLIPDLVTKNPDGSDNYDRIEHYYHQQVLDHLDDGPRPGRNPQLTSKGLQKRRVNDQGIDEFDPEMDYNTSYLEAEFEYMRDAYTQARKDEWLEGLRKKYDALPKLRAEAKAKSQATGTDVTWEDILRENYKDTHAWWQAAPGNHFYNAIGVKEKIVEDVLAGLAPVASVSADDLAKILVMGGKRREVVMPIELVNQLDALKKPVTGDHWAQRMSEVARDLQNAWKTWMLFAPARTIA
jgi:RNA polymerase sigma factor (sigma-70 family)